MPPSSDSITPGLYRPVYLWAGMGTVRMNRLKFMGARVDEAVHREAHTPTGAARMAREAGFNWAYLMYDWGFPPEVEQEDWGDFGRAIQVFHEQGIGVSGYIQSSNCVVTGSYREKDWYARDPRGRKIYYYTGRFMTCWLHPQWLMHLEEMVGGVVAAGAEGVFFDNPWHGCQPLHLGGAWLGPAGCYCLRCREAFRVETGKDIPGDISPERCDTSLLYLRWRAGHVTRTLDALAQFARQLNPQIVVTANNYDAVMRPSFRIYGIDLAALAKVQDAVMIEDYGLPRWEPVRTLVNNALTLRTARVLSGSTPISTDPYDQGIGFDDVYPPRRFQQGIAEAAACGASMVIKGTEYFARGQFTLLTAEAYSEERRAIGAYHKWLAAQTALYLERDPSARVGLLYPGEALWRDWDRLAPLFFGAGQVLLAAGIPWRVVLPEGDWSGLQVLLSFAEVGKKMSAGRHPTAVVQVPSLPGWAAPPASFLARHARLRATAAGMSGVIFRLYFQNRFARRLGDRLGLAGAYTQSPLFKLPAQSARSALLSALGEAPRPRVISAAPVLIEAWQQKDGRRQLHLVNYADGPQPVKIRFEGSVSGRAISPDGLDFEFQGSSLEQPLDIYTVLLYE